MFWFVIYARLNYSMLGWIRFILHHNCACTLLWHTTTSQPFEYKAVYTGRPLTILDQNWWRADTRRLCSGDIMNQTVAALPLRWRSIALLLFSSVRKYKIITTHCYCHFIFSCCGQGGRGCSADRAEEGRSGFHFPKRAWMFGGPSRAGQIFTST